jgi:hypothetical protein
MQNLENKRFGRLKVLNFYERKNNKYYWNCLCVCGTNKVIRSDQLIRGVTKSCGCLHAEINKKPKGHKYNLVGETYNRLKVSKYIGTINRVTYWQCICVCGNKKTVRQGNLLSDNVKSCGCLLKETIAEIGKQTATTHGKSNSSEYKAWISMRDRCLNEKHASYGGYGGRGITVCERWRSSFENFYEDMGDKPSPTRSLDRIDNEGNYSCGKCEECKENGWNANCRWATPWEQAQNRRPNKFITFNNKTLTISEWANEFGVNYNLIWWRLNRKWDVEKAITTPSRNFRRTNGRRRNGTYD